MDAPQDPFSGLVVLPGSENTLSDPPYSPKPSSPSKLERKRKRLEAELRRALKDQQELKVLLERTTEELNRLKNKNNSRRVIEKKDLKFGILPRKLGSGAFGQVYLASWHGTNVAVKVMKSDTEAQEKIETEINMMKHIGVHPHCVKFYGTCIAQEQFMIVMEYADQGSLAEYMKRLVLPMPLQQVLSIAADAAAGVAFLHTRGVAHRDISARNVLLRSKGQGLEAMISDFGLSRNRSQTSSSQHHTFNGGNWRCMAPEEVNLRTNEQKPLYFRVSARADCWSFGMFLWEIGTGCIRQPHEGNPSNEEKLRLIGTKQSLKGLPECLQDLITRCWDEPNQRPKMEQIRDELRALAAACNSLPPSSTSSSSSLASFSSTDESSYLSAQEAIKQFAP